MIICKTLKAGSSLYCKTHGKYKWSLPHWGSLPSLASLRWLTRTLCSEKVRVTLYSFLDRRNQWLGAPFCKSQNAFNTQALFLRGSHDAMLCVMTLPLWSWFMDCRGHLRAWQSISFLKGIWKWPNTKTLSRRFLMSGQIRDVPFRTTNIWYTEKVTVDDWLGRRGTIHREKSGSCSQSSLNSRPGTHRRKGPTLWSCPLTST